MNLPQRLKQYLINGFFVLVPISLSVLVVVWLVQFVDRSVSPLLKGLLGLDVPGLGLAAALVIILAVGFLVSDALGQRLLELVQDTIDKIPGLRWVYQTFKQVTDAFSPESQQSFKRVVLVEYPRPGVWRLGFVTNEAELEDERGPETRVVVYIPTNHFYFGDVALFRKADLRVTDMSVQQGIQTLFSAGAVLPPEIEAKPFS